MEQITVTKPVKSDVMAIGVDDLTRVMGVSLPVAYDLVHIQGFPALRVGKRWLIPVKALEGWLNENCGKEFLK